MPNSTDIIWISPDLATVKEQVSLLESLGYTVTHLSQQTEIVNFDTKIIIISGQESATDGINCCLSCEFECADTEIFSILIIDKINKEEKQTYFMSGGNELILSPVCDEELVVKVQCHLKSLENTSSLNSLLSEASQMALMAMDNSSDLGTIIQFVKSAINAKSYSELAKYMFDAIQFYSSSSLIEIKGYNDFIYFYSEGSFDSDLKKVMQMHKSNSRIVLAGNITQINHNNLVFLVEGLPIDDPSKMGRISDNLVMLCDIADRFAKGIAIEESIQESVESRRLFLSTLSHELRTPLNSILGFSTALQGKDPDKPIGTKGVEALSRVVDNTSHINLIVSKLFEISRLQDQIFSKSLININALLSKLDAEFSPKAIDKGLTFSISASEGISFESDEENVYKILVHLVENAIKFTDEGKVEVNITMETDSVFGERVCFSIHDTGIGIGELDQERIFTEIGQLNKEQDRKYYGVGLGLYFVNQVVQQLEGKVTLISELNKGSIFKVYFPVIAEIEGKGGAQDDEDIMLF